MDVSLFIRLAALLGAIFILAAALSSAFSLKLARRLKKPFTTVHHPLAIIGGLLIVLHPLLVAWQLKSARILVPNFSSWRTFWTMGGCTALVLVALAVIAALLMRRMPRFWRWGHSLIYPAMLLAGIHGLRMGRDLNNPLLAVFLGVLLVLALAVFFYKRLNKPKAPAPAK